MQLDPNWLVAHGPDAPLFQSVAMAFDADPPGKIAVAVSGGSDSMAVLALMTRLAAHLGRPIVAVTVDHGLRAQSRAEAEGVAAWCARQGVAHTILTWPGWNGTGNLPAAARDARYRLMADWALKQGIPAIALGHTQDDQAENFLIRLARKSGIDGLSSMETRFQRHGVTWFRPMLDQSRQSLRDSLIRHGQTWIDDPTNDDESYDRPKARKILTHLAPLGITATGLSDVSAALRDARDALTHYTRSEAQKHVTTDRGDVILPANLGSLVPAEIERRLLRAAMGWVSGATYGPRESALHQLRAGLSQAGSHTLSGCMLTISDGSLRVAREANAVADKACATLDLWDGRWQCVGPHQPALTIRALGEGISHCKDWRETGLPRSSLLASPAVWQGDKLVSAPLAGFANGWQARIVADFQSFLHSH